MSCIFDLILDDMMFHAFRFVVIIFTVLTPLHSSAEEYLTVDLSGSLNIILTAPHGGKLTTLTPAVPDREDGCLVNGECVFNHSCTPQDPNNCGVSTVSDYQTDDLTQSLQSEIYNLKQERPKMVINNVHRKKVDANRERGEATFGEEVPDLVYDLYHNNISAGISMFGGEPGIIFDIHGYSDGNVYGLALLGYLISGSSLNDLDDTTMEALVNDTSIANLATAYKATKTFSNLLRGSGSFGAMMEAYGLESVPSPQTSGPGTGKFYSGGYTTKRYKAEVDVIQVEIHYYHRSNSTLRQEYAQQLAKAIVDFYDEYYAQGTTSQATTTTTTMNTGSQAATSTLTSTKSQAVTNTLSTSTESKATQLLSSFALYISLLIII